MAISPTVQAHQAQLIQSQESNTPEQANFNKKFGLLAFTTLNAKYPKLQEWVVTFKVVDSDQETGYGMGAFIIRKGNDVVYLPVCLAGGAVTSLEMVYDKASDDLYPLVPGEVERIAAANRLGDPTVAKKSPSVEDTRQLFTNMFRPPSTSNIVIASNKDLLGTLPDAAKEALASHLESNPDLLAKIASFYPIEVLARKLAITGSSKLAAQEDSQIPSVLRLDTLTKEASQALSSDEKQELLQRGYLVRVPSEGRVKTASTSSLPVELVTELNLVEKPADTPLYGTGYLLKLGGPDISLEKCAVLGNTIITKQGTVRSTYRGTPLVLSNFQDGVSREDLEELGGYAPSSLPNTITGDESLLVFYPSKHGAYKPFSDCPEDKHGARSYYMYGATKQDIEGDIFLTREHGPSLGFVKNLNSGYVRLGEESYALPKGSILRKNIVDPTRYVESLQVLVKIMMRTTPRLKLVNDGVDLSVTESITQKTAKFRDEATLVEYVTKNYSLSKQAADKLLKDKEVLLLSKEAFTNPSALQEPDRSQASAQTLFGGGQPQMQPQQGPVQVDQQVLDSTADLEDEELMDTGLLASLSNNDDIKSLLVDLTPTFTESVTSLGKTILIFSSNKDEMEEYYGREQYTTLLSKVRRAFQTLGEILDGLKSYIKMT